MEKKLEMVIYTDYQDNHYIIFREKIDTGSLFDVIISVYLEQLFRDVHSYVSERSSRE
jgi:hypothetical protein